MAICERQIYAATVRDTFCGTGFEEECITTVYAEAHSWFKQWKKEYSKEDGYAVRFYDIPKGGEIPKKLLPLMEHYVQKEV